MRTRKEALSKACNLTRKLKKDFVAIRFGNSYVVSTSMKREVKK